MLAGWEEVKRKAEPVSELLFTSADKQVWIKGEKNWDVSILQKQNILLSTLSISWIASSCLSLALSNIFLTDLAYNGVNDKIEVTDKSIMESF